jgi:hypothetical protein
MIHSCDKILDSKNINYKRKLKYSEEFSFVGISYLKRDFCIQTPKLYSKYGLNKKYDKYFIDLSLQNICNDDNIKILSDDFSMIYDTIKNKYKNYNVVNPIRNNSIRFKTKSDFKVYDSNRKLIESVLPNTYGNYIIYLQGIWLIDNDIYFQWYTLQAKIDMPLNLEEYAFLDSVKNIPKPPPLPNFIPKPPPLPNFKKVEKKNIEKKNIVKKKVVKKEIDVPTLEEIMLALSKLKTINK